MKKIKSILTLTLAFGFVASKGPGESAGFWGPCVTRFCML